MQARPNPANNTRIIYDRIMKITYNHTETYPLLNLANCGSRIQLTKYLIFVGCAENKVIEVYFRKSMKLLNMIS